MQRESRTKQDIPYRIVIIQLVILFFLLLSLHDDGAKKDRGIAAGSGSVSNGAEAENDYIRWVDFTVPAAALEHAFRLDMDSCQQKIHLNWIDLLAFLGAKYGGDFSDYRQSDLDGLAERIKNGETIEDITADMNYYGYYREAYGAVLDGMVGYFRQEIDAEDAPVFEGRDGAGSAPAYGDQNGAENAPASEGQNGADGGKIWVTKYGLRAYLPIARDFPYSDYDDFGASRSYGYKRRHLGHDMMGQVGTPIIAVESGTVEALGWNRYGGWRIGIRSFDRKRYYYYAHLRKNYPYQSGLEPGSTVTAGDVIGYLGRTGYSTAENTNNIDTPHLHFGLQLIFDESQKEGDGEIWIDCYELMKFLRMNQSRVVKVEGTKEWTRVYKQEDLAGKP